MKHTSPAIKCDLTIILIRRTGSALAIKTWAWQLTHGKDEPLPGEKPYPNEGLLISSVKELLESGKKKAGRSPKVLVIGAVSLLSHCDSQSYLAFLQPILIYKSLDDAVVVQSNSPKTSVFPMKISSSGI